MYSSLISSLVFTISTCIFTIFVPGISTVLGIVGGVGSVALAYIIPAVSYYKVKAGTEVKRILYITISGILSAVGVGSSIYLIYDAVS